MTTPTMNIIFLCNARRNFDYTHIYETFFWAIPLAKQSLYGTTLAET